MLVFAALLVVASSCLSSDAAPRVSSSSSDVETRLAADSSATSTGVVNVAAPTVEVVPVVETDEMTEPPNTPTAAATPEPVATPEPAATPEPVATPNAAATPEPAAIPEPAKLSNPVFPAEGMSYDRVWLVASAEEAAALTGLGDQADVGVFILPNGLQDIPPEIRAAISNASEVELLSDFGENAAWRLDVLLRGHELPGGGLLLFESDFGRRLVAIYGHPMTPALGVLGEQGPGKGVERLDSIAEGYDADGSVVLPTFEIIATVASARAGSDGDYSGETALNEIRPWVETAAANDMYLVLDLQPGRTDFLTQAKLYEEFLRLPHVGLAIDPEWRLKPDEVHLRQIGTVDAAEINQVVEWLAGIVREEALPQKLLIVHQFRLSMITDRDLIETPRELAVLIHMDGQGPIGSKYDTWNALTNQADADRFHWGWKNFYDEDDPTATPEQVLELTPTPVYVSFQ